MCGIAGAWSQSAEDSARAVREMVRAQAHRGPDDEGTVTLKGSGALVLGHRRLSILDLSPAGHQPMRYAATGDVLVFNGEIYNFAELRQELEGFGERFVTGTDTEVILHAFARWKEDCFRRFRGMFALALFSAAEQRLVLARDPLGIKPLYIAETAKGFLFASEARAVVATGWPGDALDRGGLASLLAYGSVMSPRTLWKDVRSADPGTWSSWRWVEPGRVQQEKARRYWTFPPVRTDPPTWDGARSALREHLFSAVRAHLVADVPVGIFLSRGLDSSAIAAIAAKLRQGDIDTFTVGSTDAGEQDEGRAASRTAKFLGTRHHDVRLSSDDVLGMAKAWLQAGDQPSVDGLNTFIISRAVRAQGAVVALSGLGGDELFGGYSTFREVPRWLRVARAAAWIPAGVRRQTARFLLRGRSAVQKRKGVELASLPPTLSGFYLRRRRLLADEELRALGLEALSEGLEADYLPGGAERSLGVSDTDEVASLRVLESRFYMGNVLLRDSDVCSMAHGLELRVPLLDTPLLDFAYALPGTFSRPRGGQGKPLLVDAVRDLLPSDLLLQPKQGFVLPYAQWMQGPLRDLFEARWSSLKHSGLLEPRAVDAVRDEFLASPESPAWSRAWMLGVLGQWLERRTSRERAA